LGLERPVGAAQRPIVVEEMPGQMTGGLPGRVVRQERPRSSENVRGLRVRTLVRRTPWCSECSPHAPALQVWRR